jgi:hypothetical protein
MPLTILDPRTGLRVALVLAGTIRGDQRIRRQILREIDRLADQKKPSAERSS